MIGFVRMIKLGLLLLLFLNKLSAQIGCFDILGNIKKVGNGKVFLVPIYVDKKYYGKNIAVDSADIINGKFKMHRNAYDNNTYAYKFRVYSNTVNGITGMVFIEPKNQTVIIDSINGYVYPLVPNSKAQNEMKYNYGAFFKDFAQKAINLDRQFNEMYKRYGDTVPKEELVKLNTTRSQMVLVGDSLFENYVVKNTNSYVSLWKLIERFNNYGYKKKYSDIYNLLSANIKRTKAGSLLAKDLSKASLVEVGSQFPKFHLKDTALKVVDISMKKHNSKYMFIDFWFSYCEPCLAEAPRYKEIYGAYKGVGFEMIGVSVDKTKDIDHWKKNINENKFGWNQFLDENGMASKVFFINSFPTNFLLNEKGIIIKKNILPDELERFLFSMKHKDDSFFLGDPIDR